MLDFEQILNSTIGAAILALLLLLGSKLKSWVPKAWIEELVALAKYLGSIAAAGIILFSLLFWFATSGDPPPGLTIGGCGERCEDPEVVKYAQHCYLEAFRYGSLKEAFNLNTKAKNAVNDFARCLAIEDLQAVECEEGKAGCYHFIGDESSAPPTLPPP